MCGAQVILPHFVWKIKNIEINDKNGIDSLHLMPWDENFLYFQNWSTNKRVRTFSFFNLRVCGAQVILPHLYEKYKILEINDKNGIDSLHLMPWDENFLYFQNWSTNKRVRTFSFFNLRVGGAQVILPHIYEKLKILEINDKNGIR